MRYTEITLAEFSAEVAAKKSMPGGGSVAAYSASLASALASMVGNFTIGKKKYEKYDEDLKEILDKAKKYEEIALSLVDKDVQVFLPLADVYKMPENTDVEKLEKKKKMEFCLKNAASVPMETLELSSKIINLHLDLLEKGSKMLISDVGVGVAMIKATVMSAKINILVNVKFIEDREFVKDYISKMELLSNDIFEKCDLIYNSVINKLK